MKLKTNKTASKRLIITGSGKLRRRGLSAQHLVAGKTKRTLAKSQRTTPISKADSINIKKLLPYR